MRDRDTVSAYKEALSELSLKNSESLSLHPSLHPIPASSLSIFLYLRIFISTRTRVARARRRLIIETLTASWSRREQRMGVT